MFATPWVPKFTGAEVREALDGAESWREVLEALSYAYHPRNVLTVRKWAARWGISTAHLSDNRGGQRPRYSDDELRAAVAASRSWAESLRRLGYCPSGGNWRTLKLRAGELGISTEHFDPYATSRERARATATPLKEILVEGSTYSRSSLKRRLYQAGLKERRCELCGQGERWQGKPIGLILDHVNGVRDDNRLENVRIVCPNCAATLDTHCGRKNRLDVEPRECARCRTPFVPRFRRQRYCSRECGSRWARTPGQTRPGARRVERPPYETLLAEIDGLGYLGVGRKYGVSDNAIRKWVRAYERERAIAEGRDAEVIEIPRRTWPNRRRDRDAA